MFTQYMTDEEIQTEARRDFWELQSKIEEEHSRFKRPHIESYKNNRHIHLLNNIVQTKTYITRSNNTWTTWHYSWKISKNGQYPTMTITYCKIPLNNGSIYLVFRNHKRLHLEKFTYHFLRRYNERYLFPRNLKPADNMPLPIYFILNNMYTTNFSHYHFRYLADKSKNKYPNIENKKLALSDQGISIIEGSDLNKYKVYLTFLDAENLTCFQKNIYEEERFWRLYYKYSMTDDQMEAYSLATQICNEPNALKYAEGYLRRVSDRIDFQKVFKLVKKNILELPEKLELGKKEIKEYNHTEMLYRQNRIRCAPMQLPDISNPIADIANYLKENQTKMH